jgi:hypothetical protein
MNAITKSAAVVPAGLRPQSFAELERFAAMAAKSSMVPKDYINRPENVMVAIQMGSELGLAPLQALQNISVINGRPAIWGDAMLGLCRASPTCEDIIETLAGDGDAMIATCIAKRRGSTPTTCRFGVADARRAGLWNKSGPWQQYPQRMLQLRARGFALRDAFPDLLRGLISAEEARDIPPDSFAGTTVDHAEAEPPLAPIRAAAAGMAREARIAKLAPTYDEPPPVVESPRPNGPDAKWHAFLGKLQAACAAATTADEAAAEGGRPSVAKALADGPEWVQDEITAILADAQARFDGDADVGSSDWPGPDPEKAQA